MDQREAFEQEKCRWEQLFAATTPDAREAAAGLIQKAAYLHSLCTALEDKIAVTGPIKIHPEHPEMQRQVPAVREYARLTEAYANIVNKLNQLRARNQEGDDEDGLGEYEDDDGD
jgi:hypothetical protein